MPKVMASLTTFAMSMALMAYAPAWAQVFIIDPCTKRAPDLYDMIQCGKLRDQQRAAERAREDSRRPAAPPVAPPPSRPAPVDPGEAERAAQAAARAEREASDRKQLQAREQTQREDWDREFRREDLLPSERDPDLLHAVVDQLQTARQGSSTLYTDVLWTWALQQWEVAEETKFTGAPYPERAEEHTQAAQGLAGVAFGTLSWALNAGHPRALDLIEQILKQADDLSSAWADEGWRIVRRTARPAGFQRSFPEYDLMGRRQAIQKLVQQRKMRGLDWVAFESRREDWRDFVRHRDERAACAEAGAVALAPGARVRAVRGDVETMAALGSMELCLMRRGLQSGLYRSPAQERVPAAARWLDQAAQRGHARAACEMAVLHDFGLPGIRWTYPAAASEARLQQALAAGDACADWLQAARAARAGRLAEAQAAAKRVLARPPSPRDGTYRLLADDIVRPAASSMPAAVAERPAESGTPSPSDVSAGYQNERLANPLIGKRERWVEVEALLMEATFRDPRLAGAWGQLGEVRTKLGDTKRSIEAYRRAVELGPHQLVYWDALGQAYAKAKEPARAAEAFLAAAKNPYFVASLRRAALILGELGRRQEAIAAWEQVLRTQRSPDDEVAYNAYRQTIGLAPTSAQLLLQRQEAPERERLAALPRAEASRQLLQQVEALRQRAAPSSEWKPKLQEAIAADPSNAAAQFMLGRELMNKPLEAEAPLREAVRLDPKQAPHWNELGRVLTAQHRHAEAAEAFRQAVTRDPLEFHARMSLAGALGEAGDYDGAVAALREAATLQPQAPNPHEEMGRYLRCAMRYDEALRAFELAGKLDPRSHYVQQQLAELRRIVSDPSRVLPGPRSPVGAQAVQRVAPRYKPDSLQWLWQARERVANYASAEGLAAARKAIDADPANAAAWVEVARAQVQAFKHAEALEDFARAVALDPLGEKAWWVDYGNAAYAVATSFNATPAATVIAFEAYRRALDFEPKHPAALAGIANLLCLAPKGPGAKEAFDELTWLYPSNVPARQAAASCQARLAAAAR